jgi:hypothetical protein
MPIHQLKQKASKFFPRIGTIRLGIRKESASGVEYPETVPHFVLDDAPEIAKIYGNTPTEIEAFFLSDDIDEAVPAFWKWYSGGKRDKNGNVVGGQLLCWGEGPTGEDPDGAALPGTAWHKAMRDPKTGKIPTRGCLGEQCKDYYNDKGKPQCSPVMTLNLFVPRAHLMGIFTIETKSKVTMSRFLSQLTLIQNQFGRIKGIPFKIFRDPVQMENPERPGQKRTQYIVSIKPFLEFSQVYGHEIDTQIKGILSDNIVSSGKKESLEYEPSNDVHPVAIEAPAQKVDIAEVCKKIANEPDVFALFDKLASLKNAKNTEQNRVLATRRFENAPDIKAAISNYLNGEITKFDKKPDVVVENTPQPTPAVDANGLI